MKLYASNGKEFKDNSYILNAISDVICIGDSVTEGVGAVSDYTKVKNYSYPTCLSKMTGWNIENAGKAGLTALQWWQQIFANYDYSQYQVAIIELGLNSGLTDTLDTDVVGDDYTQYADTNTGGYCKIIEGIKQANPDIIIVLIISSAMIKTNDTYKTIKSIAQKYSLPVVDLTESSYIDLNVPEYHDKANDYIHFNALGYLAKAKFIHAALTDCFFDNQGLLTTSVIVKE